MSVVAAAPPALHDARILDHIIIWLDAYIGDPEKYVTLKRAFISNIDPHFEMPTTTTERDLPNLLRTNEACRIAFGDGQFLLLCFTNLEDCYNAFQEYRNYKVFFITSGSLGQDIIPRIMTNFQDIFTDQVTQEPSNTIYVFCGAMVDHAEWALEYYQHVQMFDHEADLLARMTLDAATYFRTRGERLRDANELGDALRYYNWSRTLYLNYERLENTRTREIPPINIIIAEIEEELRRRRHDMGDEDDSMAAECG